MITQREKDVCVYSSAGFTLYVHNRRKAKKDRLVNSKNEPDFKAASKKSLELARTLERLDALALVRLASSLASWRPMHEPCDPPEIYHWFVIHRNQPGMLVSPASTLYTTRRHVSVTIPTHTRLCLPIAQAVISLPQKPGSRSGKTNIRATMLEQFQDNGDGRDKPAGSSKRGPVASGLWVSR